MRDSAGEDAGRIAVFVIPKGNNEDGAVRLAVERLSAAADRVEVIHEAAEAARFAKALEGIAGVTMIPFAGSVATPQAGHAEALLRMFDRGETGAEVLLTGSHVFGPLVPIGPEGFHRAEGAAMASSYWHDVAIDVRLQGNKGPRRIPYLDFVLISPELMRDAAFQRFWRGLRHSGDHWKDFVAGPVALGALLEAGGHRVCYPVPDGAVGSYDPRLFEVDRVVRAGSPCLPVACLFLDPLIHDLTAMNLKGALDHVRATDPESHAAITRYATRYVKLRDLCTITDAYEIVPPEARNQGKESWSFGAVAVFIHAFYAEMMPEFWDLIQRIPGEVHLYITTATEENAVAIRAFLDERGWAETAREVRVVEQNRGRDMSSLFITWRDVALSGRYQVALRLHSKRTPQVARQVGESFKAHLFDNLVLSRGHVANILDRMEAEPDIGLIVPPVIHIGFGTLGHAWYNNKRALADLAKEMYVDVPLDDDTPVGAFGTMYWFRPDALWKMFDWHWKWEDYNAEPNHIDGGLAHVQERLIAYCVVDRGYRVHQVMTPDFAARSYARLEYKAQMFAAQFMSNNVVEQKAEMEARGITLRGLAYRRLRMTYGEMLRRWPNSRRVLRPFKNATVLLLLNRRG